MNKKEIDSAVGSIPTGSRRTRVLNVMRARANYSTSSITPAGASSLLQILHDIAIEEVLRYIQPSSLGVLVKNHLVPQL